MEGMKVKSLNGEVEMRKQRPPAAAAAVRRQVGQGEQEGRALRPGEHRLRLEDRGAAADLRRHAAHLLPDEAAQVSRRCDRGTTKARARARSFFGACRHGILRHLAAERRVLRAAAVHAVLGPDADLQHDGRAQLRARELLHARRLLRLLDRPEDRASGRRWCSRPLLVGAARRAGRALRPAPGAQVTATCPSCCSPSASPT